MQQLFCIANMNLMKLVQDAILKCFYNRITEIKEVQVLVISF